MIRFVEGEDRRQPTLLPRGAPLLGPRQLPGLQDQAPAHPEPQRRIRRWDTSFSALSDATRRGVIEQLGRADGSITSLADAFHMTLTGMRKHVAILERAGFVVTEKVGRFRTCRLARQSLEAEANWIEAHRKLFEARFDALDRIVLELRRKEDNGPANK